MDAMNRIRFLIMDVDGTLTDGKIYMGEYGELFKAFNAKDGCGIRDILPRAEIVPIVITARNSKIVENRCKELEIVEIHQGCRDKLGKLQELLKHYSTSGSRVYTLKDCAYIGDDLLDLPCMKSIKKAGGVVGCPADAVSEVKKIADFISDNNGGYGAVRNFIEWIVSYMNHNLLNYKENRK